MQELLSACLNPEGAPIEDPHQSGTQVCRGRLKVWSPRVRAWLQLNIPNGKSPLGVTRPQTAIGLLIQRVCCRGRWKVIVYHAVLLILYLMGCAHAADTAAPAEGGCPSCWPQPAAITVTVPGPQETHFCQEAGCQNWGELPCFVLSDVWCSLPLELLNQRGDRDREWGLSPYHASEQRWFKNPLNAGL